MAKTVVSIEGIESIKAYRKTLSDSLCKAGVFKMSSWEEAVEKGLCIACGEQALPKCTTDAGRKDYYITSICEVCYDKLYPEG